ncbi:hypothetical protein [Streptomyces sp. NPDC013455]|uniref:hypothetical protein n=1 Tax=Streptomyces sp. NPDC013455 TaxID=3155605 RepID=UPI0033E5B71A
MTVAEPDHDTAEPWAAISDFIWTDRAYDLLERKLLHAAAQVADGILTTKVWGPCPRCSGRLHDVQVPTAIGDVAGSRGGTEETTAMPEPRVVVVDVTCGCGVAHPDAPEGTMGCGVSFRVELVAEDGPASPEGTS